MNWSENLLKPVSGTGRKSRVIVAIIRRHKSDFAKAGNRKPAKRRYVFFGKYQNGMLLRFWWRPSQSSQTHPLSWWEKYQSGLATFTKQRYFARSYEQKQADDASSPKRDRIHDVAWILMKLSSNKSMMFTVSTRPISGLCDDLCSKAKFDGNQEIEAGRRSLLLQLAEERWRSSWMQYDDCHLQRWRWRQSWKSDDDLHLKRRPMTAILMKTTRPQKTTTVTARHGRHHVETKFSIKKCATSAVISLQPRHEQRRKKWINTCYETVEW